MENVELSIYFPFQETYNRRAFILMKYTEKSDSQSPEDVKSKLFAASVKIDRRCYSLLQMEFLALR